MSNSLTNNNATSNFSESASPSLQEIATKAKTHCKTDHVLCEQFIQAYYRNLNLQDVDADISTDDLAGMAVHHFDLLKNYNRAAPNVAVFQPNIETHQFHSSHSIIQMVAFDRPFLVDTLLMSLEKADVNVHRLFHTIVKVTWDDDNKIQSISTADNSHDRYVSLIHCEIDQQNASQLTHIQEMMKDKVQVLDTISGDWSAMRERLAQINNELAGMSHLNDINTPYGLDEVHAFLSWILDDNFIFLGFREYRLEHSAQSGGMPDLITVGGSGLGLLGGVHEDTRSESFYGLPDNLKQLLTKPQLLLLSKSSHESPVHRPAYMDFLGIQKFDDSHKVVGEYRFIGLFTSRAYQLNARNIPLLREKTDKILHKANLPKGGHAHHKLLHIINTLPRDDLFQGQIDELYEVVTGVASLQDRKRLKLFIRNDSYERFVSCLVYIPRAKFNTALRMKIQQALTEAFGGHSSGFSTEFDESHHARVHVHVRTTPGQIKPVDTKALEGKLTALMHNWQDDLEQALLSQLGEATAFERINQFAHHIPASYQEQFDARTAVLDIERLYQLGQKSNTSQSSDASSKQQLMWHLYHATGGDSNQLNLKVYGQGEPAVLSKVLPILEKFGVAVISAQTYEFGELGYWLQEYELHLKRVESVDMDVVRQQFEQALDLIWHGKVESDYFNELILTTKLNTSEVVVLRALSRYLKQAGLAFSRRYVEDTLVKNSAIAVQLAALFDARMNPEYGEHDSAERKQTVNAIKAQLQIALDNVTSLDEDRILRWYVDVILAMSRTNYYQIDAHGQCKDRLSFKFLADQIPNLPKPKPMFEIFVYSPRVEAVHLRGGRVARGGLRWSDRMEDFRTEVLGLVKAQMVKNAVIVPVGSKGGFVVKQVSRADGREAFQNEGVACYQTFLRGMLDVTDNLKDGSVIHPDNTVRYDGDDPYLVVAADKGTATFSDIANGIAQEYDFWLDDAFASGGSVGYDHKAMGITARGAWESVKRHFRMLGKDIQSKDDFTVMGIGDMGGDVFGNGMLLSQHIKLVGAFNHLHIFVDPTPDPKTSFAERERLFESQGGWDKYNTELISHGGGVFSRSDKSIPLNDEMKSLFAIDSDIQTLTPDELIHAMLKAPVDLLWNGGIGTYVKAQSESHSDVGDRANDSLRVNGSELGASVFGEGGNLGATQLGRIEYAKAGGHLYTDAIDNSGGVNCSDHEVNIKILLGDVVKQGDMTIKQRNELLADMTDSVAELVLRQNYLQPQTIELSHLHGADMLGEQAQFIDFLVKQDRLNRDIEYLPSNEDLKQRREQGQGLTRPELAVVLAYGKMWVYDALLASNLPDEPYFIDELQKYFPDRLAGEYFEQMQNHRLHREIISTYLTNSVVNRLGLETLYRLFEDTNQPLDVIVRAYAIARDVYGIANFWQFLEDLDNQVDASLQLELELKVRQALERAIVWLVDVFGASGNTLDVSEVVSQFDNHIDTLVGQDGSIDVNFAEHIQSQVEALPFDKKNESSTTAITEMLKAFAKLPYYVDALEIAKLAGHHNQPLDVVAQIYFNAYKTLHIDWFVEQLNRLAQQNDHQTQWDRRARYALIGEMNRLLRHVLKTVLASQNPSDSLQSWYAEHQAKLDDIQSQIQELPDSSVSLSVLSVLLSEVGRLVLS